MVEVSEERLAEVTEAYKSVGVEAIEIGKVTDDGKVRRAEHNVLLRFLK